MKNAIAIVFGALLLVGASRLAHAGNTGYICYSVNYTQAYTPVLGNYGAVAAGIYSGPSCTGSYLGYVYVCSTGATYTGACSANWLLDEARLINFSDMFQKAATTNEKVYYATDGNGAATQFSFYAAGY
jgi:hypothetical protein